MNQYWSFALAETDTRTTPWIMTNTSVTINACELNSSWLLSDSRSVSISNLLTFPGSSFGHTLLCNAWRKSHKVVETDFFLHSLNYFLHAVAQCNFFSIFVCVITLHQCHLHPLSPIPGGTWSLCFICQWRLGDNFRLVTLQYQKCSCTNWCRRLGQTKSGMFLHVLVNKCVDWVESALHLKPHCFPQSKPSYHHVFCLCFSCVVCACVCV